MRRIFMVIKEATVRNNSRSHTNQDSHAPTATQLFRKSRQVQLAVSSVQPVK